jgi:hypothetical protein
LKLEDYYPSGKRYLLRFREKGGKEKELPVHHKLEQLLDQYLKVTGLEKEPGRTWNEFDTKRNLSTVKNDWANFHQLSPR